jgi:hypothetical protein
MTLLVIVYDNNDPACDFLKLILHFYAYLTFISYYVTTVLVDKIVKY